LEHRQKDREAQEKEKKAQHEAHLKEEAAKGKK